MSTRGPTDEELASLSRGELLVGCALSLAGLAAGLYVAVRCVGWMLG